VNLRGFSREMEAAINILKSRVEGMLGNLPPHQMQEVESILREEIPESLEFINSSVSRMDRLIGAIVKVSRMEHAELVVEPLDMKELVEKTASVLAHQVRELGIQVKLGPLPEVIADRTAMEQIIGNLLDNAIKYTDPRRPGEIEILGWRSGAETHFSVKDNGLGIREEDQDRIFDIFQRGTNRKEPGEGIGLACVRTLVRRHGGGIWCESIPGSGSTFTFTVSNQPESKKRSGPVPGPDGPFPRRALG
ncbi:MAG: HAMP domain-containing histidine kinase, partial [Deltaproteobacteria bacterium]|nr:HAMP domain-containing histidine kinase [Deltaproteobacteria bacterium]